MDAYMKMMAKKEKEREAREEEEEERRKRSVPLLNETSFDRRKVISCQLNSSPQLQRITSVYLCMSCGPTHENYMHLSSYGSDRFTDLCSDPASQTDPDLTVSPLRAAR